MVESSSHSKPVVVRVKRKLSHAPLDAFWLEINERPLKRAHLDFGKLAISESSQSENSSAKKILVQHVETVSSSEAAKAVLQSFMVPSSTDGKDTKRNFMERRHIFKQSNQKQGHMHSNARQQHDELVRNARFEQLWKSRNKTKETTDDSFIQEFCHLYDVIRVDENMEEASSGSQDYENASLDGCEEILCNFLPLIREHVPEAAAEIESYVKADISNQDGYAYDLYTVGNEMDRAVKDELDIYPLVHVEDEDELYDGQTDSEFDYSDSNDEDNPRNDYPDEDEISSSENEVQHTSSEKESDDEDSNSYEEDTDDEDDSYNKNYG